MPGDAYINLAIIGSDNGLSPIRHQAIIRTNAVTLLITLQWTIFNEILIEIQLFFIQENAFENTVWEKAAILFRPQCDKSNHSDITYCCGLRNWPRN